MTIGNNIRYLRKQKGWTQEDLAKRLNYKSFTTIQKWESGVSEPPLRTVKELSDLFGVSVEALANANLTDVLDTDKPEGYYYDPEVAAMVEELRTRPGMRILFDAARDLTLEDIDFVVKFVEKMKGGE